ncbi:MBL fold metallo-hydrolase [Oceanobacillus sp. CAU 1775]
MKLTVVGIWGGFPKSDGACSGYLLEHEGFRLLIDCGSGVAMNLQKHIELHEVDHVIISHYHYDHVSDLGALMFGRLVQTQLGKTNQKLSIYGPMDKDKEREITSIPNSTFESFDEASTLNIGPFQISFIKNIHSVETYGMKIIGGDKSLVYTADTSFMEEYIDFAMHVDLLIAESSFYEGMDGKVAGHMNAEEVGVLAKKAEVKKTMLTHLPHFGELEELVESARRQGNQEVFLAKPGLVVEI